MLKQGPLLPLPPWAISGNIYSTANYNSRLRIVELDGGYCVYCFEDLTQGASDWTIDHLIPQTVFGYHADVGDAVNRSGNYEENLVACCAGCNSLKGHWPYSATGGLSLRRIYSLITKRRSLIMGYRKCLPAFILDGTRNRNRVMRKIGRLRVSAGQPAPQFVPRVPNAANPFIPLYQMAQTSRWADYV